MSTIAASGRWPSTSRRSSSPDAASATTSIPARRSSEAIPSRMSRLSSAITTRMAAATTTTVPGRARRVTSGAEPGRRLDSASSPREEHRMVIRWAPWEVATSALFTQSQHQSRDTRARLAIPVHQPAFWVVLLAAAAAAQYGVLRPGLTGELPLTTYQVAYQFVGGSFAVCGIAAWRRRPDSGSGPLMTATGFTFFIYPLLAQLDLPAAQTLALVLSNLWSVLFVALALTYGTGGRVATPADRRLIAAYAIAVIGLELVLMLFRDMPGDVLAAFPDARLAQDLDRVRRFVVLCMNVVIAAVLVMRWRAASRPRRKVLLPSLAAAVCLLLFCGQLVFSVVTVEESPTLAWVAVPSLLLVPAAFLAGLLRSRLAHGGLTELFHTMHGLRGAALESSLARAMGDPNLLLAYRIGHSPAYAGTDGRALSLPTTARDRLVAPVRRDGREVAALVYDAALDDDRALVEAVRSAAEIALEREGLQAESQERLLEPPASRPRLLDA